MKTKLIGIFVCMLLIAIVLPVSGNIIGADGTSNSVISGITLYVGGSGPNNYTRIQDAIDDAVDGDTVFVYDDSSPYYENLVVDSSINLIGEDRNSTVIDGSNSGSVVQITANDVALNCFTIQNIGNEKLNYSGIEVFDCDYNIISDNVIRLNQAGILLLCTYLCNITNNLITSNQEGIIVSGARMYAESHDNIISRNVISYNTYGILCAGESFNGIFSNNIITNNRYGLEIHYGSYYHVCTGNNISNNLVGLSTSHMGTNITQNNFIKNIRHAKHWIAIRGGFADYGTPKCIWNENYWGKPRDSPYRIPGRIGISTACIFPWFPQFDWHPAQEPYEI